MDRPLFPPVTFDGWTTKPKGHTMTTTIPTNADDVIDSRDVIAAIEELRGDGSDPDTLAALEAFAGELSGYCADWEYGETLIRDSYFKDYAMQLAEDVGAVNPDAGWPNNCIDWAQAARELRQDYTSAEFDGVTYWGR